MKRILQINVVEKRDGHGPEVHDQYVLDLDELEGVTTITAALRHLANRIETGDFR